MAPLLARGGALQAAALPQAASGRSSPGCQAFELLLPDGLDQSLCLGRRLQAQFVQHGLAHQLGLRQGCAAITGRPADGSIASGRVHARDQLYLAPGEGYGGFIVAFLGMGFDQRSQRLQGQALELLRRATIH